MQTPINNPRVTGGYSKTHPGIDYGHPNGTPVVAAASGTILVVTNHEHRQWIANGKGDPFKLSSGANRPLKTADYGNYIMISHGNGVETLYAHLKKDSLVVTKGQVVKKGQKIAEVGSTGNSSGNHLHFEVRLFNKTMNPNDYFIDEKEQPNMDAQVEREYRNFNWANGVQPLLDLADTLGVSKPGSEPKPENKNDWEAFSNRMREAVKNVKKANEKLVDELDQERKKNEGLQGEVQTLKTKISELEKEPATPPVQPRGEFEAILQQLGRAIDERNK